MYLLHHKTNKRTLAFLKENVPNFIEHNVRPPNSPDLNPLDYAVWSALQQLVCRQKIQDIECVKEVHRSCLDMISEDLIDGAIDQWSRRIAVVIQAQGGHIKHRLK